MATEQASNARAHRRDYTALTLIAALGVAEVAILYVLIAVETPLTPLVQRLLDNPAGVFTLVVTVVWLLSIGVTLILGWAERRHPKTLTP
jgi:hypothetical protein